MRLTILLSVCLLFSLGLMMVFNTSSAEILDRSLETHTHHALLRQMIYAALGVGLALAVWKVGYAPFLHISPQLLVLFTLLLVLVFVPGIGTVRNGAHRWLGVGGLTLQPSEFVKYLIPMTFISWMGEEELGFASFCKRVALLAIPLCLVLIEPDNGSAAVIVASLIPVFFLMKVRFTFWAVPMIMMIVMGGALAYNLPYVRGRIEVYLHPEKDLRGRGHQPHQAKIAAGSGGFLGRGPGASLQKMTYLPEAQNDYIAAIFAEEFGFVGILLLITLYMLFACMGFSIALQAHSQKGAALAMLVTYVICLQAFLNLGVVSGLLPSKGVNLPFFSQGGTSLIANCLGLTLLFGVADEQKTSLAQCRGNGGPPLSGPGSGRRTL